jgi:hypothetical protein
MQYMLLVYEPEEASADRLDPATLQDIVAKHMALAGELQAGGHFVSGGGLQGTDTATTVLTGAGGALTLHDGPFAETRELLAGYYLIEVPDLDAALAWARKVPGVPGAKCEVRPLIGH